jgi:hypothetical protein
MPVQIVVALENSDALLGQLGMATDSIQREENARALALANRQPRQG